MKTQHIKFEILKERLSLFYCNIIQHNFVLDMFSIGQICEENFHPFGDVMDDFTKMWMLGTGKLLIQLLQNFLRFDRLNDLHFRILTHFVQISSTQQ